jgi:hypothetical protein
MEKQIMDLTIFTTYKQCQVVLNYYQEDELLIQRNGFNFETIQIRDDRLSFMVKGSQYFTIDFNEYPEKIVNIDFPNYYTLRNNTNRLDIYFP